MTKRCTRCNSLMIEQAEVYPMHWLSWRCTACGDRIDEVIEAHRAFCRGSAVGRLSARDHAELLFSRLFSQLNSSA